MLRAIDRAVAVCRDVLRYARIGEAKLQKTAYDLRDLIEDAGEAAPASSGTDTNKQFQNLAPERLIARLDRTQLARAIGNLARNAYDASAETVTAAATTIGGTGVRFFTADNGAGIPGAM
jgi:signal transduction histidine kinase